MTTKHLFLLSLCVLALTLPLFTACLPAHASSEIVVYNFKGGHTDGSDPSYGLIGDSAGNGYGTTAKGGPANFGTVYKVLPNGHETVLHSFSGSPNDGEEPFAGVILAKDGNLYGTTEYGGANGPGGYGTVYKITPAGQETVLYSFQNGSDGAYPIAGLVQGKDGNFYGTTNQGGSANLGTVYKITPTGQETVLYSFTGGADGSYPLASLLPASDGSFYGTTEHGGSNGRGGVGYGTVYKITPGGQETVLYGFTGGGDGSFPQAGVIQAKDGNLYGTTLQGGPPSGGGGTVYKITLTGSLTTLYSFSLSTNDGVSPQASLIQGKDGSFYGTTYYGGVSGYGTVYKITAAGQETVVYAFTGFPNDGAYPEAPLVQDKTGYLYGTTSLGGNIGAGNGIIFRITL